MVRKRERRSGRTVITVQELVDENLDRVEPVHQLRLAASRDALVVVPFAKVPHSDLVEVVQPSLFGQRVSRLLVSEAGDDNIAHVNLKEIEVAEDVLVRQVADLHEDKENERNDEQERCEYRKPLAMLGVCS